ncbi:two-component sensor histidine kinase [Nocardia huaxiensis]|uniref:histidine kinase n=1 Tax=Nocardia huaxiensis TaxID=2755382 RepID=A0A7D6VBK8_9NOCA|nr:sensor histidine kinase [Nocardia huaxiensis]QLY28335.1 two-component sensor histidine kinase [Nocardia huaxiensis]
MARVRPPRWIVDVLAVAVAAADAVFGAVYVDRSELVFAVIACAALLVRRRWPVAVFALTLPTALTGLIVAPAVALYTVGRLRRERSVVFGCAGAVAAVSAAASFWPPDFGSHADAMVYVAFTAAWAAAPVLFGLLMRTRDELARRLVEIEEARDHERNLHAQAVLARERAQIGREMHDVVSHQVSLIAVRAGALAVAAPDQETREAARTIRGLSVATLDELRSLVTLLRASGGQATALTPQPTLADLTTLIDSSGIAVEFAGTLPDDVSGAGQRAVYRTVQEALTNVRKHAPGATAEVCLWSDAERFGVVVTNAPPTRGALALPGSGHGLIGLAERAELLNGQMFSGPTEVGGFRVELRLPRT